MILKTTKTDLQKTNYQAQINNADGAISERLYKIIGKNNEEKLTTDEFKKTLGKPWHLGLSGMILSWVFCSRRKVIATVRLRSEESAVVKWFGFYNDSSKSREWVDEPDFAGIGIGSSILSNCNS